MRQRFSVLDFFKEYPDEASAVRYFEAVEVLLARLRLLVSNCAMLGQGVCGRADGQRDLNLDDPRECGERLDGLHGPIRLI